MFITRPPEDLFSIRSLISFLEEIIEIHRRFLETFHTILKTWASAMAKASITSQDRERKRLELVANFPTDIKLDGQVGPLQCARIFEEKAYTSAVSKNDYEQKINQCLQLRHRTEDQYEILLEEWKRLSVGGDSSQPRAGEQGSSSSSTMGQAAASLQPMNHPTNQAPAQQQAQQQNQVPVQLQQARVENTLEPATQDAETTGLSPVEIERNKVWEKLQILNAKYLADMNELYIMLTHRSNQPMPAEQLQKLKHYKDVLHRMIPYLRVPKERVPKEFNMDKVEAFEKQITSIMDTFKRRRNPQPEVGNGAPAAAGVEVN